MPVDYQIDHEVRFVTITGRGAVVLKDILHCMGDGAVRALVGPSRTFDLLGLPLQRFGPSQRPSPSAFGRLVLRQ